MYVPDVEQGGVFLSLGGILNNVQRALTASNPSFMPEVPRRFTLAAVLGVPVSFYERWRADFAGKFFAVGKKAVYVRKILCVRVSQSRG